MSFAKFISMLQTQTLFFSSLANLEDSFEGAYPDGNIEFQSDLLELEGKSPQERDAELKEILEFWKRSRRSFVVKCWFKGGEESYAMWNLYAGEREGVAIRSDVSSLWNSFTEGQPVFVGEVQYIDYKTDTFHELDDFAPALMKRKGYANENEVRGYYRDVPMKDGEIDNSPEADNRPGVYRKIDLDMLVKEVRVAPGAAPWFVELVEAVTARYGLKVPVQRSSLADTPNWGQHL